MKAFAIILAFYIGCISILPCQDDLFLHEDDNIEVISEQEKDDTSMSMHFCKDSTPEHRDLCSPFCTCQCCQTAIIFSFNLIDITSIKTAQEVNTTLQSLQSVTLSVLVPPPMSSISV